MKLLNKIDYKMFKTIFY